jgi:hypothetical protein
MPMALARWICSWVRPSHSASFAWRQILWLGVTAQPTAEWIANQLTAACGCEQIPRDLIRDRDACCDSLFVRSVRSLGIRDHPTSPRSPWQNGYAEGLSAQSAANASTM